MTQCLSNRLRRSFGFRLNFVNGRRLLEGFDLLVVWCLFEVGFGLYRGEGFIFVSRGLFEIG